MKTRQSTPFFSSTCSADHNSGREHENQTINSIFFIYFFCAVCISEFQNTQNSFSCGPPIVPFWSVKYRFGQLIIRFQEVDTLHISILCFVHLLEPNTHFLCSSSWTKRAILMLWILSTSYHLDEKVFSEPVLSLENGDTIANPQDIDNTFNNYFS